MIFAALSSTSDAVRANPNSYTAEITVLGGIIFVACNAAGQLLGIFQSTRYLKKSATIEHPIACVLPATIWFIVIQLAYFGLACIWVKFTPQQLKWCLQYFGVITPAFWLLTKVYFTMWERSLQSTILPGRDQGTIALDDLLPTVSVTVTPGQTVPPANLIPSATADPVEKMAALNTMLANGFITQADFDARKKQILDAM